MGEASSILRRTLTVAVLAAVCLGSGCQSLVEAMGYTVVDDQLVEISAVRDKYTQAYIDRTLPLVDAYLEGDAKEEIRDMGETLKRVSAKEHALLKGLPDE